MALGQVNIQDMENTLKVDILFVELLHMLCESTCYHAVKHTQTEQTVML